MREYTATLVYCVPQFKLEEEKSNPVERQQSGLCHAVSDFLLQILVFQIKILNAWLSDSQNLPNATVFQKFLNVIQL